MTDRTPSPRSLPRWPTCLFILAWLALLAVPPVMLLRARPAWLAELSKSGAQEDWEDFRRDMRAQTGSQGPVQRKVPKSPEPPARVWMRDHVALAITAWLVMGGTLGAFLGVMVAGATRPGPRARDGGDDHSPSTSLAVAATVRKSTMQMPKTPRSENTARTSEGMIGKGEETS